MTIAAAVSAAELTAQVKASFENKWFEVALIKSAATFDVENDVWDQNPANTTNNLFLNELDGLGGTRGSAGTGTDNGYGRRAFEYVPANIQGYNDLGIPLARKTTVFSHNGIGTGAFTFSHAVLLHSGDGHVTSLGAVTVVPTGDAAFTTNTYTNLPTSTTGNGEGATVDLAITAPGTVAGEWAVTLVNAGTGYANGDTLTVPAGTLQSTLGNNGGTLTGDLTFTVGSVNATAQSATGTRQIVAVAKTSADVTLVSGNESVFYWDLKLFGYHA